MAAVIPRPGPHGGDGPRLAAALGIDVLDLSQSLNPVAPDVEPVVARHLGALARYPDAAPATAALADVLGVDPDRLVLTNGGAEAIALVAAGLGGSVVEPEFSLYPRAGGPRWRSNPHSPSGRLVPPDERAGVWDEAFYPLATGTWTRGDDAWVVGSLTKLLGCPGLRVGYVLAPDAGGAAAVRARQPAWSVNGLVCAGLRDLLEPVELGSWARRVAQLRDELVTGLAGAGLVAEPSDACWVLVEAPGLRERLGPRGVAVRDCSSFGLPRHVR
ncbi:MAG: aminotransferase class I/II-fold pyridoxal phosphate-dependent enzyme, partial [Acidimicrobiales bacterium]